MPSLDLHIRTALGLQTRCVQTAYRLHQADETNRHILRKTVIELSGLCNDSLASIAGITDLADLIQDPAHHEWSEQLLAFGCLFASESFYQVITTLDVSKIDDVRMIKIQRCISEMKHLVEIVHVLSELDHPCPIHNAKFEGYTTYSLLRRISSQDMAKYVIQAVLATDMPEDEVIRALEGIKSEKDFRHLEIYLKGALHESPIQPLEKLRHKILGNSAVSASECSDRLADMIDLQFAKKPRISLCYDENIQAFQANTGYRENCLERDLTDLLKGEYWQKSNNRTMTPADGESFSDELLRLMKDLKLSDRELSLIALQACFEKTIGQAFDHLLPNPFSAACRLANDLARGIETRNWNINSHVNSCLKKSLLLAMTQEAQDFAIRQSDKVKALYYNLTEDPRYLSGLEDESVLSSVLERDMGL